MLLVLKRISIAAFFCALGAGVLSGTAQEKAATYPVRGAVLSSISHRPIARALVNAGEDAVLTDNDGRFELSLSAGIAQVIVRRPGYGANKVGMIRTHSVKVGANMPDLTFYLTPDASIGGQVVVPGGEDADHIRVMASRKLVMNGHEMWTGQFSNFTDSEGVFHMVDVDAPNTYLLCTMQSLDEITPVGAGKPVFGYAPTCYPGVTDLSAAGAVQVSPGQQVQVEFALSRQPFYPVSIVVSNHPRGNPGLVMVREQSGHGGAIGMPMNPQQGTYETNLPNGHYSAEIRSQGKTQTYGRVDFQVAGGPVVGLSLVELPLHSIAVEIHKEFTANKNEQVQTVRLGDSGNDSGPGLNLNLFPVDASMNFGSGGQLHRAAGSADDTLYELDSVTPGRFRVQIAAYRGYVASVRSGDVDLARDPLVIGAGDTTPPIEITLRDDGGSISGKVRTASLGGSGSGQDVGEMVMAWAYAVPQFPNSAQIPSSAASEGANLSFGNLAPGSYRVVAFDQPQDIDLDDAQDLARLTAGGQTVTVEAGGTTTVQLDVVKTAGEGARP